MVGPGLTICCVDTVHAASALRALQRSCHLLGNPPAILFSNADLFDDAPTALPGITFVRIAPFRSVDEYSAFVLTGLLPYVATSHVLLIQWDGFVVDGTRWRDEFFDYDYIGAAWPQFSSDRAIGNGGFSLRSKKLLEALCRPEIHLHPPEDICICHSNRSILEGRFGIRFAPPEVAVRFSFERGPPVPSLGFHGLFNFPDIFPDRWRKEIADLPLRRLAGRDAWDLGARLISQKRKGARGVLWRILKATLRHNHLGLLGLIRRWGRRG